MSNELPPGFNALIQLADDMVDGLQDHGDRVGIKQWTDASLTSRRDTAKAAKKAHGEASSAEEDVTGARKVANSNAKGFIATARRMLLDDFGSTPNRSWETVGWPPGSTAAPDTLPARKKLLNTLVPWLAANPGKEVPQKNFTAALDEAGETALRTGMGGLVRELESLLSDDSPDWYYFGLVPPAKAEPPAPVEHVILEKAGPGTVIAGCDRSPRGQKYRFAIKVEAPATPSGGPSASDWLEQPLVSDPQLILKDLPATGTLHARAAAHNAAGDSPWSAETTLNLA